MATKNFISNLTNCHFLQDDYEGAMIEVLVENDMDTIMNSPSGMAYLADVLHEVYGNLSGVELRDELQVRGLQLPVQDHDL